MNFYDLKVVIGEMMGKNIARVLSITLSIFVAQFLWLSPSLAGDSPWPLFLAAINAAKNNTTPTPPNPPLGTVTSAGRIWVDRNLGASRVATSSTDSAAYGDLFQWGRGTDGHEKRNSPNTTTLSSNDTPGHGSFILAIDYPHDWRSPQNDSLWQGVSGTNNPCPPGFRLPSEMELNTERLSWSSNNSAGAFASPLRLVVAGIRNYGVGTPPQVVDYYGAYWSSTVVDTVASRSLHFYSTEASMLNTARGDSYSVRCLKD